MTKEYAISIPYRNEGTCRYVSHAVTACTNCFVIVTIKSQRNIYNLTVHINISLTLYPFYCTMYIIVDNCIVEYNSYYDQCISCNYNSTSCYRLCLQ